MNNRISDALSYNDEAFEELYNTKTLINALLLSCQNREFKGQYYGIPNYAAIKLSNERNEYMSFLTMISDKIDNLKRINLGIEKEITNLHKDTDDSSRQITA